MLNQVIAGPQVGSPGTILGQGGTTTGATRTADAHGRYSTPVSQGNVYIGSNLGGTPVTTQAGLSATTPALTLYNPLNSQVNLHLLAVGVSIHASPAAAMELWLAYNTNVLAASGVFTAPILTTLANVTNAIIGNPSLPVGQCARVCTLSAAPLMLLALGGTTGASAIGGVPLWFETAGIVVVSPGSDITLQTGSAGSITGCFVWQELPTTYA